MFGSIHYRHPQFHEGGRASGEGSRRPSGSFPAGLGPRIGQNQSPSSFLVERLQHLRTNQLKYRDGTPLPNPMQLYLLVLKKLQLLKVKKK